ncbi:putative calcium-binding protein [Erysiphe neolycopersici]|uniref:Putative calcium-binding protein n=1 Tax=Erysiphe neolycopersici TaxID=212602 RepID=A0A420HUI6_9PEZI|nr:putative calcium-binding protein [Erysiphe neolycopersici]
MVEEHHIDSFDKASFFSLHDYDDNDVWDVSEVLKTYGMDDPSAKNVPEIKKNEITQTILDLLDRNKNNIIERGEYMAFEHSLPDFGLGPGHHWDMETEYEIHHWQKFRYHNENTKMEELTHAEDLEHFKIHDQLEDEAEAQADMDKLTIVEVNIPAKFKKI